MKIINFILIATCIFVILNFILYLYSSKLYRPWNEAHYLYFAILLIIIFFFCIGQRGEGLYKSVLLLIIVFMAWYGYEYYASRSLRVGSICNGLPFNGVPFSGKPISQSDLFCFDLFFAQLPPPSPRVSSTIANSKAIVIVRILEKINERQWGCGGGGAKFPVRGVVLYSLKGDIPKGQNIMMEMTNPCNFYGKDNMNIGSIHLLYASDVAIENGEIKMKSKYDDEHFILPPDISFKKIETENNIKDQIQILHDETSHYFGRHNPSTQMYIQKLKDKYGQGQPSISLDLLELTLFPPDKEEYNFGDQINLSMSLNNKREESTILYSPHYRGVSEIVVKNSRGERMKPQTIKMEYDAFDPFYEISARGSLSWGTYRFGWTDCEGRSEFTESAQLPPDTYQVYVTFTNPPSCPDEKYQMTDFAGTLKSNTVTLKIKPKAYTQEEFITIAFQGAKSFHSLIGLIPIFDNDNQLWEREWARRRDFLKTLPAVSPQLAGRNYQAVYFSPPRKANSRSAGIWAFVDRLTGKMITVEEEAN